MSLEESRHEVRKEFNEMSHSHRVVIKCKPLTALGRRLRLVILQISMRRRSGLMVPPSHVINFSIRQDVTTDRKQIECTTFGELNISHVKTSDSTRLGLVSAEYNA